MKVLVFRRNGRKTIFVGTITLPGVSNSSRPTSSPRRMEQRVEEFEPNGFELPPRFAQVEETPHSTRIQLGWTFGEGRDFSKPRSWKDWRTAQYKTV